jgi:signal transduction histidine kinase
MITLKARLNIGLGVILAAGFGLQWALRSEALPVIIETQMVSRLDADIEAIRESLHQDPSGNLEVDVGQMIPLYRTHHSGHYFLIESPHQRLYSPSLGNESLPGIRLDEAKPKRWHTSGPEGEPLLMLTRGIDFEGVPLQISVGEDLTELNRHISEIGSLVLMLNGATIFIALILQTIFVRNALQPYIFLRKELASIASSSELDANHSTGDLMRVQEIRQLIELIQNRIERSRNAIGNLAHSLKNPLTVLLRLSEDPSISSDPKVRESLQKTMRTVMDIVEGELRRARMASSGLIAQPFDLKPEIMALVQAIKSMYPERTLTITQEIPETRIPFDRHDFMELAGNLLDNAAKWANTTIAIEIRRTGQHLHLVIEDDGKGCDELTMRNLMIRGARLDESKAGHGLGLSIVNALLDQYEGTISFSRSKRLGGLRVDVDIKMMSWTFES